MKKNQELWTVESGCYSDHQVMAVFEDEATAEAWAEALRHESGGYNTDAYVGRLTLYRIPPHLVTTWQMHVELWDDGRMQPKGPWSRTEYPLTCLYGPPPKRPRVRYVRAPCHKNLGGRLEVIGDSEMAVAKVASERIAMWKAGAWAGPGHDEIKEEALA